VEELPQSNPFHSNMGEYKLEQNFLKVIGFGQQFG